MARRIDKIFKALHAANSDIQENINSDLNKNFNITGHFSNTQMADDIQRAEILFF